MEILDSSYIHGHNVGMRVNKAIEVIPAKDVLRIWSRTKFYRWEKETEFKLNPAFFISYKNQPS